MFKPVILLIFSFMQPNLFLRLSAATGILQGYAEWVAERRRIEAGSKPGDYRRQVEKVC